MRILRPFTRITAFQAINPATAFLAKRKVPSVFRLLRRSPTITFVECITLLVDYWNRNDIAEFIASYPALTAYHDKAFAKKLMLDAWTKKRRIHICCSGNIT